MTRSKRTHWVPVLTLLALAGCARTGSPEPEPVALTPIADTDAEPFDATAVVDDAEDPAAADPVADERPGPVHADWRDDPHEDAVKRGLAWLASKQGNDGGWGQDAGADVDNREGVALEHSGNDVANTAMVALAMLRAGSLPGDGKYGAELSKALEFILARVEKAPDEGLAVTDKQGTQIQRKLGRYVDTFLATMVLTHVDRRMPDEKLNARVDAALKKCIAKIESNQQKDGSWNTDGWAPVISTSLASKSLWEAERNGREVRSEAFDKVDEYTKRNVAQSGAVAGAGAVADAGAGSVTSGAGARPATRIGGGGGAGGMAGGFGGSAGVQLYGLAQAVEQLSRTKKDREANDAVMKVAEAKIRDQRFVDGFGSMGGEEFISYHEPERQPGARTGGDAMDQVEHGHQGQADQAAEPGRQLGRPPLHHRPRGLHVGGGADPADRTDRGEGALACRASPRCC